MSLFDVLSPSPAQMEGQNPETRILSSSAESTSLQFGSPEGGLRALDGQNPRVLGLYTTPHAPETRLKTDHIREEKWGENGTSKGVCTPAAPSKSAYVPPNPCPVYAKTASENAYVPPQAGPEAPKTSTSMSQEEAWAKAVVIRCRVRKAISLLEGGAKFGEAQWETWNALWLALDELRPFLNDQQVACWWAWLDRAKAGPAFAKAEQAWTSIGELEGAAARWGWAWAEAIWVAVQAFASAQEPLAIKRAGGRLAALVAEAEAASKKVAA